MIESTQHSSGPQLPPTQPLELFGLCVDTWVKSTCSLFHFWEYANYYNQLTGHIPEDKKDLFIVVNPPSWMNLPQAYMTGTFGECGRYQLEAGLRAKTKIVPLQ